MALTVGSLFSGIGGIDLGLERAGMVTRWFVEIDPHCRNVLARHWPGLPIYGDITAIDWSGVESVDVLAGGFPCQPVSNAGKRLGQADERWLWPEFARAVRALRPRYVLVENVAALLTRGFDELAGDLAALGYDNQWDCIPASAIGAPHERDRFWTVAYASSPRRWQDTRGTSRHEGKDARWTAQDDYRSGGNGSRRLVANAKGVSEREPANATNAITDRRQARYEPGDSGQSVADAPGQLHGTEIFGNQTDGPNSLRSAGRAGRSGWWATEPGVGRVADGVPHRVDRLRALGNAVVPQVVEWIGRRIVAFDERGRVAA